MPSETYALLIVGVAKNLHVIDGLDRKEIQAAVVAKGVGGHIPLVGASGRTWGAALLPDPPSRVPLKGAAKAKEPVSPIFVSVGHRISLESSLRIVNLCCVSRREPEPTRIADIRSREKVRQAKVLHVLFDALSCMDCQVQSVSPDAVLGVKDALKEVRAVVADKELLKSAARVVTILEPQPQQNLSNQQAKFDVARAEALKLLAPALGPPLRKPLKSVRTRLIVPSTMLFGICVVVLLLRRKAG